MPLYDLIRDLPLHIERYELERRSRKTEFFERVTTTFHLIGENEEGLGEDVVYDGDLQDAQISAGPVLPLSGEWTVGTFSEHLEDVDAFHGVDPQFPAYRHYRRWAIESAALDLALRQADMPLHEILGREMQPIRFVVSLRLGDPPDPGPVLERIAAYPGVRFKLDPDPSWDPGLIADLAATGAVDVLDLKGLYKNTPVDVPTDAVLYERVAQAFGMAWIEDPDVTEPDADAALEPYRDRITWDEPIHSVEDVLSRPFPPRALNCKPSRFGALKTLLDFYEHCEEHGIGLYGGGQSEQGVGRGQIQYLASMFHAGTSNDIAPRGWDHDDWPRTGLPVSPLNPDPEPTGFRRQGVA